MSGSDLVNKIRSGRATALLLPQIFDDANGVPDELRLKALSTIMRSDPPATRPYFDKINSDGLAEAVEAHRLEPDLIALAVRAFPTSDRLNESAFNSPITPTGALLLLTEKASKAQLSQLIREETRLIMAPELIGIILANRELDQLNRSKLEALQNKTKLDSQYRIRDENRESNMSEAEKKMIFTEAEEVATVTKENIYSKLQRMTIAEKVMLCFKANRITRMLLIRDPNKMISKAVLRSPRITEQEIEIIAKMREVDEDVLRAISLNKRWMRKYSVMKNLAFNPRSPIQVSLSLIERISNSDIKTATRDHNLPSAVRQAVMRIATKRKLR